jgi:probable HAF family extracellular repeat protein
MCRMYTPGNSSIADLGTLGGTQSEALQINSNNKVVGISDISGVVDENFQFGHAFLYTGTPGSTGQMRDLGTLGGQYSAAISINTSGQITGCADTSGNRQDAMLYTGIPGSGGSMSDLGVLPGANESKGESINDQGDVVGSCNYNAGDPHAFIYIGTPGAGGQMIDLNTWLATNDPIDAQNLTIEYATGINDAGWITGSATYGGTPFAFLLNASSLIGVPEPMMQAILLPGALLLLRRRHRLSF